MDYLKNKKVSVSILIVVLFALVGAAGYALKKPANVTGPSSSGEVYQAQSNVDETIPTAITGDAPSIDEDGATAGVPAEEKPAAEQKPAQSTVVTGNLSNNKKGWGLKRNDTHQQPEMSASTSAGLSKYGAYWIGGPDEKTLYLTFDEGYENGYTSRILDILKANDVKAAFFVTGHYLKSQPELVKRMVDEGHIVGNHTDSHPSLPGISDEEIKKELQVVEQAYEQLTGRKGMKYLRPPMGEYSERTLAVTRELGYHNIFWSMAFVDWVPMPGGPDEAYQSVMDNLHNGALILLHAVSKDNTEALDKILKDTKAQGYSFKTLDDLAGN
ncbi:Peptidoglycan-N-acetylmuramic acid deacetylase PdaA precursor [Pelotomaculum schinkii]|uniref:Peptidoglycan-N-acetylmuramic acid deacetylase PdaA n=1 Tax=Pelotomaculum schinkii TaxID=78350 RepID=A0A4Y7RGU0_9FIRM|nr:delta-lactam-biosynthetic de-N-acetylase [Pelotomaculum schinkii]TEB08001.1 Peptidoglycan-N-acetylmuramic acid deacetylase PdaA precursor [Pelotomaculum schinkii]